MIISKSFNIKNQLSSLQLFTECDLWPPQVWHEEVHLYGIYTFWLIDKNGSLQLRRWYPQYRPIIYGRKYITYSTTSHPEYKPYIQLAREVAEKEFFSSKSS